MKVTRWFALFLVPSLLAAFVASSPSVARAQEDDDATILYATADGADGLTELWWIDPGAGSYGLVGSTGHQSIGAIAFEEPGGTLWGVGQRADTGELWVFEIDTETGAAEPTVAVSPTGGSANGLSPRHRGQGFPGVLAGNDVEIWRIRRNGNLVLTDVLPVLEKAGGAGVTHRPGTRPIHWVFEYGGAHKLRRGHVAASLAFDYAKDTTSSGTFTVTGAATCGGTMYLMVRDDLEPTVASLSTFDPRVGGDVHLLDLDVPFDGLAC